jgi:hypothetical protein
MIDHLLTFEMSPEGDQLFIHGDPKGLRFLSDRLLRLAQKAETGEFDHDHLFTEAWAGHELSADPKGSDTILLNHVKAYGWPVEHMP